MVLKFLWPLAFACIFYFLFTSSWKSADMMLYGSMACSVSAVALIVSGVRTSSNVLNSVLTFGPLLNLGKISYGVYLWHFPVFRVMKVRHGFSNAEVLLYGTLVTLVAALMSYVYIERPLLCLRKRDDFVLVRKFKQLSFGWSIASFVFGCTVASYIYLKRYGLQ